MGDGRQRGDDEDEGSQPPNRTRRGSSWIGFRSGYRDGGGTAWRSQLSAEETPLPEDNVEQELVERKDRKSEDGRKLQISAVDPVGPKEPSALEKALARDHRNQLDGRCLLLTERLRGLRVLVSRDTVRGTKRLWHAPKSRTSNEPRRRRKTTSRLARQNGGAGSTIRVWGFQIRPRCRREGSSQEAHEMVTPRQEGEAEDTSRTRRAGEVEVTVSDSRRARTELASNGRSYSFLEQPTGIG